MKNHYLLLFDYDRHANSIILDAMIKAGEPLKTRQLMGHLLAAQQIWFNRCNDLPPAPATLWDEDWRGTEISKQLIADNHKDWLAYINSIPIGGFDEEITYTNSRGETYTNKLADIITHVINHGTHHRAQIGVHLKATGIEVPLTDFIAFVR